MDSKLQALGEHIHDAMIELHRSGATSWTKDLAGGCAVAAWFLYKESRKKLNLNIEFHCNGGHAWNEFQGHIFDITGTQYGVLEKVFVVQRNNLDSVTNSWHKAMYDSFKRRTIDEVNAHWPTDQQPANFRLKWLNKSKAYITYKERRT